MSRYERQVTEVLAAAALRGPTRFAWLGRLNAPVDAPVAAAMDAGEQRFHLSSTLSERLRRSWYCHGRAVPALRSPSGPVRTDQALVRALSDANTGHGTWQRGWTVKRLHEEVVVASDGVLSTRIPLADCRADEGRPRQGGEIAVRLPKELPFYSPGFHMMLGDADFDGRLEQVRVYWHVTASGAPALVRTLTHRFNEALIPFELKVASNPLSLHRCDGAVLYLPADRFAAARALVVAIAAELAAHLRPPIPALTLQLAPGVGLAESLRRSISFGTGRCALLADALVRAHEQGITANAARLAAVREHFAEAGVALDAPYREPALHGRHVL